MRSFEEIGRFEDRSDKVNNAYQRYATAYLDKVDDNLKHFFWRDKDIAPLQDLPEDASEDDIANAYLREAIAIEQA